MAYTDPDLVSDETALAEQFLDSLADQIVGWEPHDGHVEPAYAEGVAVIAAAVNALLKDTARQDYAGWGQTVLGIPPLAAVAATGITSVHFTGPGTLPAGAQLVGTLPSGDAAVFITTAAAGPATAGQTITGVPVAAQDPGVAANGATGILVLQDPYAFVDTVTFTTGSGGGVDAEDPTAYVNRLTVRTSRMLDVPVTVADFASAALDIPGVARALGLNLLDPAAPAAVSEGHLTLVPLNAAGAAVAVTPTQLTARFGDNDRPLNVKLHTATPTVTAVTVTFTATVKPGADGPASIAAGEQALRDYLSPARWGLDENRAGRWAPVATIYYLELDAVLQNSAGIDIVQDLRLNGAKLDQALPGIAPLPNPTVTGTLGT